MICSTCGDPKIASRGKDSEVSWRKSANDYYKSCKECLATSQRERRHRREQGESRRTKPRADIHTLWCPHNEYPSGRYFDNGSFETTLDAGCFTLGMIVTAGQKKYVVCGDGRAALAVKKADYPARLPKQWLREVNGRARK